MARADLSNREELLNKFNSLFLIFSSEDRDLIMLKNSIFSRFLLALPEEALAMALEAVPLSPPIFGQNDSFREWVNQKLVSKGISVPTLEQGVGMKDGRLSKLLSGTYKKFQMVEYTNIVRYFNEAETLAAR